MNSLRTFGIVALFLHIAVSAAHAMSIDPATWEELVYESDLVAVVECTVAGGIVAEYACVEVLKGDHEVGDRVRIRIHPDAWGDMFPAALVGERYLVAGSRPGDTGGFSQFRHPMSVTMAHPLAARDVKYDYQLPVYQGRIPLPVREGWPTGFGRYDGPSVDAFKTDVRAFLARDDQERIVLRSQLDKYVFNELNPIERREPKFVELQRTADADGSVEELVDAMIALAREALPSVRDRIMHAIQYRATNSVARHVLTLPADSLPIEGRPREYLLNRMREVADDTPRDHGAQPVYANEHLAEARATLREKKPANDDVLRAVGMLVETEPDLVADALKGWTKSEEPRNEIDAGYIIASTFTIYCPSDREKHFRNLLDAKDEWIRTTAAVYLCFEDEKAGLNALRRLARQESNAGAWAEFTLLRRGDKASFLPFVRQMGTATGSSPQRRYLKRRITILMSNSAVKSGIPQPSGMPDDGRVDETVDYRNNASWWESWWDTYEDAVEIHDPWWPELEAKKVD